MESTQSPTPERLMQMAWGYAPVLIIESALKNGVFDELVTGAATLEELSERTGASQRGLRALLNVLAGMNLLKREGDSFSLTEESRLFLVSSSPASLSGFFKHSSTQLIPSWLELPEVTRTGSPSKKVNQEAAGAEFFTEFVESLFPLSYMASRALGEHLQVASMEAPLSVLDLGAGSGVWGIALAQQHPDLRIHAVDWPPVLEVTRRLAARHGVAERLETAPGDLLEADFGSGHRIATIGHILHSEGVGRSRTLLQRTFEALAPGGTVAIMEFLPDNDRRGPMLPLIFAVNMLVNTEEGDTFTFEEISGWLTEAGFENSRLLDGPGPSPLILADKPV